MVATILRLSKSYHVVRKSTPVVGYPAGSRSFSSKYHLVPAYGHTRMELNWILRELESGAVVRGHATGLGYTRVQY